jgi:hypothetical protein
MRIEKVKDLQKRVTHPSGAHSKRCPIADVFLDPLVVEKLSPMLFKAYMRHEQVCDPTWVDGILDRLVHNAHRIQMRWIRCVRIGGSRMHNVFRRASSND